MAEGPDSNGCDPKTKVAVLKERINNFITTNTKFQEEVKGKLIIIEKSLVDLPCKERYAKHTERFKWLDRNILALWGITGGGLIAVAVAYLKQIFK